MTVGGERDTHYFNHISMHDMKQDWRTVLALFESKLRMLKEIRPNLKKVRLYSPSGWGEVLLNCRPPPPPPPGVLCGRPPPPAGGPGGVMDVSTMVFVQGPVLEEKFGIGKSGARVKIQKQLKPFKHK
jgi:hypothetical protein